MDINKNTITIAALGNRNPGAMNIAVELMKLLEDKSDYNLNKKIMKFILNLLDNNITGARLWYIYKNEAKQNISNLLELNLFQFTTDYFYEAFEKYL